MIDDSRPIIHYSYHTIERQICHKDTEDHDWK